MDIFEDIFLFIQHFCPFIYFVIDRLEFIYIYVYSQRIVLNHYIVIMHTLRPFRYFGDYIPGIFVDFMNTFWGHFFIFIQHVL